LWKAAVAATIEAMQAYLGLSLLWLATVYLALTHPGLPGWAWGLLMAGVFLWLSRRSRVPGLEESGVLLLGWGLGAMLADLAGLRSLKLIGLGTALWTLGTRQERSELGYLGVAVAAAGVLVGLFEVGAAPWVAALLVLAGVYVLLTRDADRSDDRSRDFEARYRKLVEWRLREARRRGLRVDQVLPDELLARLARAEDRWEVEEILGPEYRDRVEELAALLFEAQRVP